MSNTDPSGAQDPGTNATDGPGHGSHNHGMTVEKWARAVLNGLGIEPDHQNVHWMVAWAAQEGGHWNNTAHYNPINTTLDMPGATSMNGVGVKSYGSWAQGIKATIKTLEQSNMSGIVKALGGHDGSSFAQAVVNSPWGTKSINIGGDFSSYGKTAGFKGGGVYTAGGGNLNTNIGPQDIRQGLNSMGFASQLIHSNKSLEHAFQQIIHEQLRLSTAAGQARATQILQNTNWFQNHTKAQRQFDELKFSDPKQWANQLQQARDQLHQQAISLGLSLDPNELQHMAHMVTRNGLTSTEVNQMMARHFTMASDANSSGTIGQTLDSIRQQAQSYYVPISDQMLQHYTRQVIGGQLDPTSLSDVFKQQALSMFPYLKDQLNGGQTVAQIADPYKQMMSQTLEIDPNGVKHNDPLIMQALQSKGQDGQLGIMPLYQFQQKLYDDPRWLQTQNAKQSLLSTTGQVLQKMGLIT